MKNNNLQRKIWDKIEKGEVKMKPKWEFRVKEWIKEGGWLAGILVIGFLVAGGIYWIEIRQIGELWGWGELGKGMVLQRWPWGGMIMVITGGVVLGWLFGKMRNNYRMANLKKWLVVIMLVAIASGVAWILKEKWELGLLIRLF